MNGWALLSLGGSSVCIGIMAQLRKRYQVKNGSGMLPLMIFALVSSVTATLLGLCFSRGIPTNGALLLIAAGYAVISTVSSSICLSGTAFGSLTMLMTFAQLGSLVLPSAYGLLLFPEENTFTPLRAVAYLLALSCIALNFVGKNREKSKRALIFNILCVVLFFSNGSALILYDLKNRLTDCSNEGFITAYMALSAALALPILLILLLRGRRKAKLEIKTEIKQAVCPTGLLIAVGYALFFYAAEFTALWSAGKLAITVQSTISFALPLIVVVLIDLLLYREKPTKIAWLQMVLAFLCGLFFVL